MTRHVIDLEGLQEVLSGFIELPEGELREMCTIEKVTILMWSFSEYVGCRSVGRYQFVYVNTEDRLYEFNEPCTKASISLPFFVLEDKPSSVFYDEARQIVKESYWFPVVSEGRWRSALERSLQDHNYKVNIIYPNKTKYHFCQFSGGGDFYITNRSSLSVVLPNMYPTSLSESKPIYLNVEAKRQNTDIEDLQYQLWANMFLLAVQIFREYLSVITKQSLIKLEKLIGYGMVCSGDGVIGAYKVEIPLKEGVTKFITKLELGARDRIKAAALTDHILKHFDQISE